MSYATRSSPFSFYDPKRKRKEEETCAGRTITDYITDRTFIHIVLWEGKRKCEMCKTDICKVIRVAIIGRIYASRCNAIWSKERNMLSWKDLLLADVICLMKRAFVTKSLYDTGTPPQKIIISSNPQ